MPHCSSADSQAHVRARRLSSWATASSRTALRVCAARLGSRPPACSWADELAAGRAMAQWCECGCAHGMPSYCRRLWRRAAESVRAVRVMLCSMMVTDGGGNSGGDVSYGWPMISCPLAFAPPPHTHTHMYRNNPPPSHMRLHRSTRRVDSGVRRMCPWSVRPP